MANITKEEFHKILCKLESECDGHEVHLRHLWKNKDTAGLFRSTGIDFTELFKSAYGDFIEMVQMMQDSKPVKREFNITFHTKEGWDQFHKALKEYAEHYYPNIKFDEKKDEHKKVRIISSDGKLKHPTL